MRAVVTGAARGLGEALVGELCSRDIDVIGTVRSRPPESLQERCEKVLQLDLSSEASIDEAVAELVAAGDGIDLLVNNAGIDGRAVGGLDDDRGPLEIDPEVFRRQVAVNALGPLLFTRGLVPLLRSQPNPRVANLSSRLGHPAVAAAHGRDVGYIASKAALTSLTAALARSLPTMTIVSVHPGWIRTGMGGPDADLDVHEAATTLASTLLTVGRDRTGALLTADGRPFEP